MLEKLLLAVDQSEHSRKATASSGVKAAGVTGTPHLRHDRQE